MIKEHPFGNMFGDSYEFFVFCFSMACSLFLVRETMMMLHDIKEFYLIKRFVNDKLGICEREMRTILWPDLVTKVLRQPSFPPFIFFYEWFHSHVFDARL